MKETIYSIPINESFEISDGCCPVCRLHARLNEDALEYTLGPAMMEPDTRESTNEQGFCAEHLTELMGRQKALPLALVLQTHMQELMRRPALLEKADSCYICGRVNGFLELYYSNIIYLWRAQPDFKRLFDTQKYICRPHIAGLLTAAERCLPKKERAAFAASMTEKATAVIKELEQSLAVFVRSFDHRFAGEELGEHKAASRRAADFMSGGKAL